jgi:uncharacterized membrane protein
MRMMRKTTTAVIAAALGTGAAIGVAACGEDRSGEVQFEDGTGTETTGTGTEATGTGTETTGETTPETTGTTTTP